MSCFCDVIVLSQTSIIHVDCLDIRVMEIDGKTYFLVITLILQLNTEALGDDETPRGCESPIVIVAAVEQTQAGIRLTSTPALPDKVESTVVTELPDVAVPQEVCGQDYVRCPLECRRELNILFCTFPIRNKTQNYLALVKFKHTPHGFKETEQVCLPPKAPCVPLQVFESRLDSDLQYFVPCLNTTSDDPFLYFEELKLFMTNLTRSSLVDDSYISSHFIRITGESLSRLVYQDDTNCFPKDIVFFKDGSQVIKFRIFDEEAVFYRIPTPIENCPNTEEFDAFEPDQLRIQCSEDNVLVYDACNTESVVDQYTTTVNATVFQCSTADVNVFHYQGRLTFKPYGSDSDDIIINDIILPFNDTSRIQCVGRDITVTTLFITRSNGELYHVNSSSGGVQYLAANTCGPHSCVNLNVLEIDSSAIVGFFDYSDSTYTVLNLTCQDSPVISHIPYPNPPILFSLMSSSISQPCPICASLPPPTIPGAPNPDETSSPSGSTNTPTDDLPGLDVNDDRSGLLIGVTSGAVVFLLLTVAAMGLAIVFIVKQ